jgi:Ca2+-binding EF-hand superfamily protein
MSYRILPRAVAALALVLLVRAPATAEEAAKDRADKPGATPPGKGSRFDLERFLKDHDTNKDGCLTRNELPPELRPAFDRMDADKDGKVSREELARGIAHLQPARRHSDLILVLVEMSGCDDACPGEVQRAYDILRKLDKNKDGKIDADELKAAREQVVKDRVDYLFKELDKNKDGKISRDEAKGLLRQDFDEIDRNKDGSIDREELTRAATARQEAADAAGSRPKAAPAQDK